MLSKWHVPVVLKFLKCLTADISIMARIKITQVRSVINRPPNQRATMVALGLRKMNQSVEHENTPAIAGMVRTVSHLVNVEEVK